ncbi:MAG: iron-sulfur cluster assembly protein [Anaerolineales bacterium]|nr:iron-sulfur cluster assembly protein [Anaerolineales bacterium]
MAEPSDASTPKTLWLADRSHPQQTEALRKALGEVMDPELGLSILQLGMIREVEIRDKNASIRMILTTPFCPYGPALMENARQKAEQALGLPVVMEMGEEAWEQSMMDEDTGADWGLLY